MKDNKHIDRVFQEKLKDLDIAPDPSVWEAIEKDLKKDKKTEESFRFGGNWAALPQYCCYRY